MACGEVARGSAGRIERVLGPSTGQSGLGHDRAALYAVNFMADMQAGMGSHLGMLLQGCGWTTGAIGTVSTTGAIAGMVAVDTGWGSG